MATKAINQTKLTDTLTISECVDGYWLYDYSRGMNLSMRAKTETDALVEAITYYQKRTKEIEDKFNNLNKKVNSFLEQFEPDEQIRAEQL